MDPISGIPGLSLPTPYPAGPTAFASMAADRLGGAPELDQLVRPGAGADLDPQMLGQQLQIILVSLVGLLARLLMGSSAGGQGAAPVDGGGGGGEAAPISEGGGAMHFAQSDAAPVNGGNSIADNSGHDVSANASGTAFPVVGYKGKIELHHGSNHGGADLFAPRGTPVVAMRGGTVENVGSGGAGGNSVTIKGEDGLTYYYAHLDQAPAVSRGQTIRTGQQIGVVGDSGNAKGTGTHLHIGIGHGIVNGTGAAGGTGSNFDATRYLQQSLSAQAG